MYTPHQIPWTVDGAFKLLQSINSNSGKPFYLTIDVGHQCGQKKFNRPDSDCIRKAIDVGISEPNSLWLGTEHAWNTFKSALKMDAKVKENALAEIERDINEHSYLFSNSNDSDPYNWVEKLGSYSPIIHLQQTNGNSSSHLPFTDEHNYSGVIKPDKMLNSLVRAYECNGTTEMLPLKCEKIFFTLEIFSSTADINRDIIKRLAESVSYWRKYIPEDGIPLDQLIARGE